MALTKVSGDFIKDGVLTQAHLHTSHGITTAHIGEGSNLYFTNARVDSRIGDLSTSNLSEGSNLYYTNARADARIALQVGSNLDLSSKSTSDLSEGTNLYYTQARFNTAFTAKSTSDLSEGTNLYYTDARVGSYLTANSYATQSYVNTQVSNLVDSAPSTLDTLNELAAALGDDANFSTTVTNSIATKMPLAGGTFTGDISVPEYIYHSGNTNARIRFQNNRVGIYANFGTAGYIDLHDNGNVYIGASNSTAATFTSSGVTFAGTITASGYNNSNWDTAYGWGNHASAGYLTSYIETDTLATVTGRGNTTSATITVNQVIATNNGSGTNYRVGDDAWIGDINIANTLRISGVQNSNNGYIAFGNSSNDALGRAGTGALTWAGNTIWHAGNDGPGSGLNADLLDGIGGDGYLRSNAADSMSAQLTMTGDNLIVFGPNSGWSKELAIGGNANHSTSSRGSIGVTNGNLHIDAANGSYTTYLNFYDGTGGVAFGSGATSAVAWMGPDGDLWKGSADNTGYRYWHAANDGAGSTLDADLLDGLHASAFLQSESDTLATVTARGASTSTAVTLSNMGNHYQGHFYYDAYSADGAHYPHFLDGGNANGVDVNWRLYTGNTNSITHLWNITKTEFRNQLHTTVDARAPIYYDRNDTNYYINPNSTSQFSGGLAIGTISWDTTNLKLDVNGRVSLREGFYMGVSTNNYNSWSGRITVGGSTQYWQGQAWYFNGTGWGGGNYWSLDNSGNSIAYGSHRAPIFYDSNNTNFYAHLDNSGGNTSINAAGVIRGNWFVASNYTSTGYTIYKGYDNWNHFISIRGLAQPGSSKAQAAISGGHQTSFVEYAENNSTTGWFFIGSAGSTYEEIAKITKDFASFTQVRAPIFYDTNNTNYYVDPASTSVLNGLTVGGNTVVGFSGSWNGGNMPGSRWNGYSVNGGEIVFQRDNPNNGQMSILVDGNFYAGENNGFWSLYSGNSYNTKIGWISNSSGDFAVSGGTRNLKQLNIIYDNNSTFYLDLDGTSRVYRIEDDHGNEMYTRMHSGSDFADGTLVQTDITSNTQHGPSFVLEATGKSYSADPPFNFMVQGYLYNYSIIAHSGIHIGKPGFTTMKVFDYNGKLAFWWPRVSYWNSFDVHVRNAGGDTHNLVTSISNSTEPSSSKKVSVTMRASSIYGYNPGTSYATNAYAQVYYDTDNTVYKLDPHSTSVVNTVHFGNNTNNGFIAGYGTYSLNIGRVAQMSFDWNANYNAPSNHGIMSTDSSANFADSISINSYNDITLRLDSNNNNGVSYLRVKDGTSGSGNDVFTIDQAAKAVLGRSGLNPQLTLLYNDHSSGAGWDTSIHIGRTDDLPNGTSFPTYTPTGGYGIQFQANSDGVFYGMKQYSSGNYTPYINWGDDGSDTPMEWAFNGSTQMSLSYNGNLTIKDVLYMSHGGFIQTVSGGVMRTSFNFYAERFYDYYDSSRYIDVNSTSYIATLHTSGTIQAGNSGTGNIYLGNTGVSGSGNHFRFHTNNSHTYFDGNCGDIHWRQGSSTRFYFYMTTANMTINGTLTQYSDERLKQNIVTIDNALNKVNQLRGVYYNRTDINTEANQIGLIAQETESVVPEVVHTANDELGTKSISYGQLNALLVEAIKELKADNDSLRARIETLENQ